MYMHELIHKLRWYYSYVPTSLEMFYTYFCNYVDVDSVYIPTANNYFYC